MSELVLIYLILGELITLRALSGIDASGIRVTESSLWMGCVVVAIAVMGWPFLVGYAISIARNKK